MTLYMTDLNISCRLWFVPADGHQRQTTETQGNKIRATRGPYHAHADRRPPALPDLRVPSGTVRLLHWPQRQEPLPRLLPKVRRGHGHDGTAKRLHQFHPLLLHEQNVQVDIRSAVQTTTAPEAVYQPVRYSDYVCIKVEYIFC